MVSFQPVYARKRFDITWRILKEYLMITLFKPQTIAQTETDLNELWSPNRTLATFTVRSGFDLCLQAWNFEPGSEVIISAVTVPDMVRILEAHKLIPVPVDIDDRGCVATKAVEELITDKTKAIVIAHLFGSRMPLKEIVRVARRHKILVIEDCAEAFCGRGFTGCEGATISMFSFGSIKTATAFGGALITVRDPELLSTARNIQETFPRQTNGAFVRKLLKYCVFKLLTDSPWIYGLFIIILRLLGIDHNVLIRRWSRSFQQDNLLQQIRRRPSEGLLKLLSYRIFRFQNQDLDSRRARIARFAALVPQSCRPLSFGSDYHQYWLCPIQIAKPEVLIRRLYDAGFDAADGGTSLAVASAGIYEEPSAAKKLMSNVVYIPLDHDYDSENLKRLANLIHKHHYEDTIKEGDWDSQENFA
ncbi:pyridoxal phosphate-dependent transferase [Bisporella sp. PMI_857]|nr:pyridoxal phosphate-dependent transferase [Bisporella sp. PMI_857]